MVGELGPNHVLIWPPEGGFYWGFKHLRDLCCGCEDDLHRLCVGVISGLICRYVRVCSPLWAYVCVMLCVCVWGWLWCHLLPLFDDICPFISHLLWFWVWNVYLYEEMWAIMHFIGRKRCVRVLVHFMSKNVPEMSRKCPLLGFVGRFWTFFDLFCYWKWHFSVQKVVVLVPLLVKSVRKVYPKVSVNGPLLGIVGHFYHFYATFIV